MKSEAQALRALEEVERLIADAAENGVHLDPWIADLAEELRAAIPQAGADDARSVAARIAREPRRSLAAQSGAGRQAIRALKP